MRLFEPTKYSYKYTRGQSSARLPPEPCIFIHIHLLHVSVTSTLHALLLVVPNCLSARADTIYVDVSVSNTSRAVNLVGVAPLYGYWYVIPLHQVRASCYVSHRIVATGPRYHRTTTYTRYHGLTTGYCYYTPLPLLLRCSQVGKARTLRSATWHPPPFCDY